MKKQMAAAVGALLLIFSFSLMGWAQEGRGNGRLNGVVYDVDKNPLKGVKVTLEYLKYNLKLNAETNEKGQWAFIGLGKGAVKISLEMEGFIPAKIVGRCDMWYKNQGVVFFC